MPKGSSGPNGDKGANGNGSNGHAASSHATAAAQIRAYLTNAADFPDMLRDEAFGRDRRDSAIVIESAEGVTTFGGAAADPSRATEQWLKERYREIAEQRHKKDEEPQP